MKIFDMPCTDKHKGCSERHAYTLRFESREDAVKQADEFIEEIIRKYATSSFFHYNYDEQKSDLYLFRFSVVINERTEYEGELGHILNDGVMSVFYDPGFTFSYVTVEFRMLMGD